MKNVNVKETVVASPNQVVPLATMCSVEEFVRTNLAKRRYPVESMNSFMFWMKQNGCPKRWPPNMWQDKLEEFLNRKV